MVENYAPDRSIHGVPTGTTAFLSPPSYPAGHFTSLAGFRRLYSTNQDPFALSVAAFFLNGGQSLFISPNLTDFEQIPDISLVAAPGTPPSADLAQSLIAHCEQMRYRLAILDSPPSLDLTTIEAFRKPFDSSRAALYYPWVKTAAAVLPPSAFAAGICARTPANKAPASEPIAGATGLEADITTAQQDILNPAGINLLRTFPGRGIRVWGARTLSSDPAWKYVNISRYVAFLEDSIQKGTQWVVFEPHGEALRNQAKQTISDFLLNEFRSGALLGDKPEKAFFVKCDRTTMTQDDLDNGRLICEIGIAPLRPAEFIIIRISQWTADHKPCCPPQS
jgi:phage tail sheath protein FI